MNWKIGFAIVLFLVTSACGQAYNTPTPTPSPQPTSAVTATPTPPPPSPGVEATPTLREIRIEASEFRFTPATITVNQGETVRLVVRGGTLPHTFTVDELGLDILLQANREVVREVTPTRSGTFKLYCSFHLAQNMVGTFEVRGTAGATPPPPLTPTLPGPSPTPGGDYQY